VHFQDEPFADPACLPMFYVCQLAKRAGVKVVLGGEGADELFWGYIRYQEVMKRWRFARYLLLLPKHLRSLIAASVSAHDHPARREFFDAVAAGRPQPIHMPLGLTRAHRQWVLRDQLTSASSSSSYRNGGVAPILSGKEDFFTTLGFDTQEYEFALRLPEILLMRVDRFSMANSVEARAPFLDPDLVDFVYRLPLPQKLKAGTTKVVLRRVIADLLPARILKRPKQGFTAPVASWLGTDLGVVLKSLLTEDSVRAYFNTRNVEELLLQSLSRGRGEAWLLWPVLNFALWHKYWIEGEDVHSFLEVGA
jgi:asparagine synthase (glutamine-hydrolysing)